MRLFGYLLITVLALGLIACDRKESDTATIRIQFDETMLSNTQKVQSATLDNESDGPNWGLNDPTSLSQINCYAVLVGGPEKSLKRSSCDFFGENDDDDDSGTPSITTLEHYNSIRKIWVADNQIPRTVALNSLGDASVRCSLDGGANFVSNCLNNGSIIWEVANYNTEHLIEVTHSDDLVELLRFTPSSIHPNLTFETCEENISVPPTGLPIPLPNVSIMTAASNPSGYGNVIVLMMELRFSTISVRMIGTSNEVI